jgi:hypothetical protein
MIIVAAGIILRTHQDVAGILLATSVPLLVLLERIHKRRAFSFVIHARSLGVSGPAARRLYRRYRRALQAFGVDEPTKSHERLIIEHMLDALPVVTPLAGIDARRPRMPKSKT